MQGEAMRCGLLLGVMTMGCIDSHAFAEMEPRGGGVNHHPSGTLKIDKVDAGVHIHGHIADLPPGEHGLHIFAEGCEGEHSNPQGRKHGGLRDASHAGDLGNIVVDEQGEVEIDITTDKIAYSLHDDGLLERWIGVSFFRDDLLTDPDGNSGSPIACGRIEVPGE